MKAKKTSDTSIVKNKKAFFHYEVKETHEAGISLMGSEVKSLRQKNVNLGDSYISIDKKSGELFLKQCHIAVYKDAAHTGHTEPMRERKLLMHKREIQKLGASITQKGFTLIPLGMYFNKAGRVKISIGVCVGKKLYDKRESIKEREQNREIHKIHKQKGREY